MNTATMSCTGCAPSCALFQWQQQRQQLQYKHQERHLCKTSVNQLPVVGAK
jgi:hypothetical protein